MAKKAIIILLCILMQLSCTTHKNVVNEKVIHDTCFVLVRDTIIKEIKVHDTVSVLKVVYQIDSATNLQNFNPFTNPIKSIEGNFTNEVKNLNSNEFSLHDSTNYNNNVETVLKSTEKENNSESILGRIMVIIFLIASIIFVVKVIPTKND